MSVNLISGNCFHCGGLIVMDSCLKFYSCENFKTILGTENKEEMIKNCKKFSRNYLHRTCKEDFIEEINSKIPTVLTF